MKNKKRNWMINILFWVYCLLLIWIILFKLSFSIDEIRSLVASRNVNLIPFYYDKEVRFHFREVAQNFIIFIPYGLYLKMLDCHNKRAVYSGFVFSFVMEISQFVFKLGSCDITDIITNTLGTVLGVYLYVSSIYIFKNKAKVNMVLERLAFIVTILFVLLLLIIVAGN